MRLTKIDKDAFVRAVMDDVPQVDYDEQVRSLMNQWGFEALPAELQTMAKKYPKYFDSRYIYTPANCTGVQVVAPPDWAYRGFKEKEPEKYAQLVEIGQKAKEQTLARDALRSKVRGLIESCSTLKSARERLPEFEKYLPADRGGHGTTNLPVANTLADLVNAGWPKGEGVAA